MISRNYSFIALVGLVFVLAGCGAHKPSYKAERLNHLSDQSADYTKTKNGITVRAKKFAEEDNSTFFGEHNEFSQKDGIVPVQLTIENGAKHRVVLDKNDVRLPLMGYDHVIQKIGVKGSRFNWSAACAGSLTGAAFWYAGIKAITSIRSLEALWFLFFPVFGFMRYAFVNPYAFPIFFSPLWLFPLLGFTMGNKGKSDLKHKMLNKIVVYPRAKKSSVIFVSSEDYRSKFDIQVIEKIKKQRNKLNFSVNLCPII